MTYQPHIPNKVSLLNSTSSPLSSSATYTGTYEDVSIYEAIQVIAITDVVGTLYYDFSTNGTDTDNTIQLSSGTTSELGTHGLTVLAKFGRVRLVNGGTWQGYLRLQTIYSEPKVTLATSKLAQNVSDYSDVINSRSIIIWKTEWWDYYQNISSSSDWNLEVALQSPVSAFGELATIEPQPVAQIDFVYWINTLISTQTVTGSWTVTASGGLLSCSTSATTSSSAQLVSKRYLKYRPWQGWKWMFTASFTTGIAGSAQYAWLFTTSLNNGFGFGYDGTVFGIWYMKDWTPTHIPQTTWNVDLFNGASGINNKSWMLLIPTNWNVFKIVYQYLGFGAIKFYIENTFNGQFTLAHEIKYANTTTTPSISQPSLNLLRRSANTTNNTNIVVKGASGALFLEWIRRYLWPTFWYDNNKTGITTQTNVFTIRNATSYNGISNRSNIRLRTISFAANTNGATSWIATCKITVNATLWGSPSYTTVNGTSADQGVTITSGNSTASVDTAGTTVTGGNVVYNSIIGIGNNFSEDITDLDIFSNPWDLLTFSITSTQSVTAGIAVTRSEDI